MSAKFKSTMEFFKSDFELRSRHQSDGLPLMISKHTYMAWTLVILSLSPLNTHAHSGATGVVKERMKAMKLMRQDIKELRFVLESKGLDVQKATRPAKRIAALAEKFPMMFPKGSNKPPSEALAKVWLEWSDFQNQFTVLAQSASTLAEAAQTENRQKAVNSLLKVRDNCQTCHDRYQVQD